MTRPDRGRTIASNATGMGAQNAQAPDGRVVGYGMGGGAGWTDGAPGPQGDAYGQQPGRRQAPVAAGSEARGGATYAQQQPYATTTPQQAYAAAAPQPDYARYAQASYVPPATSQPQEPAPKRKRKRRAAFWIGLIVALLCIALAVGLAFTLFNGKAKRQGSLGQLEGKTDAEIQAELDRVVDEGMFNISIASTVQMERGDAPAELRIENVPGNRYLMKVDIVRDDTGERIYETDMIEPNHHIQTDTLDVSLPAGYYDCTAIFYAFDQETEDPIGQAAAKIVLQVAS